MTPFISSSTAYYQLESQKLLSIYSDLVPEKAGASVSNITADETEMEIWDYLTHVRKRLSEEGERCDATIGKDVKGAILRVVEETLVGAHTKLLLDRGLVKMLEQQRTEDLAGLYSLFAKVSSLAELKNAFHNFVKVGPFDDSVVTYIGFPWLMVKSFEPVKRHKYRV